MLIGDVVEENRSPTFLLGLGGLAEAGYMTNSANAHEGAHPRRVLGR
jgi:hypothetical protein